MEEKSGKPELVSLKDAEDKPYYRVAAFLAARTKYRPRVGIICGTGLGSLTDDFQETNVFNYHDIPDFPVSTVAGHISELVFGLLNGLEVVAIRGRFHYYEGHKMDNVVLPVRVMRLLGVQLVVVTNASGGLNPNYNVGDVMIIQDHFALPVLAGNNPLIGRNDDLIGQRFISTSDTYKKDLQDIVLRAASDIGLTSIIRPNGCYCFVSGPTYESPTESRFLQSIGGDAVGMSTIPDIIESKHCGMQVIGLALITNKVVMPNEGEDAHHASHADVLAASKRSTVNMKKLVCRIVGSDMLGSVLASSTLPDYDLTTIKPATCCGGGHSGCHSNGIRDHCSATTVAVRVLTVALVLVALVKF